jgi:hypothetical protein
MRHFSLRLRGLQIDCSGAMRREAIQWLVEAALDCTIPEGRVTEALRLRRGGHSSPKKARECPS